MKQREAGVQDMFLGLTADVAVAWRWLVTSGATPGPHAQIPTRLPGSGQHVISTRWSNACAQPAEGLRETGDSQGCRWACLAPSRRLSEGALGPGPSAHSVTAIHFSLLRLLGSEMKFAVE